jgi:hypothetical protein
MSRRSQQPHPIAPTPEAWRAWASALSGRPTRRREDALVRFHALLLHATRSELARRRGQLSDLKAEELEELVVHAAEHALMATLRNFAGRRGTSHFTTWAAKFVLRGAGVAGRRHAWQARAVPLDEQPWPAICATDPSPADA